MIGGNRRENSPWEDFAAGNAGRSGVHCDRRSGLRDLHDGSCGKAQEDPGRGCLSANSVRDREVRDLRAVSSARSMQNRRRPREQAGMVQELRGRVTSRNRTMRSDPQNQLQKRGNSTRSCIGAAPCPEDGTGSAASISRPAGPFSRSARLSALSAAPPFPPCRAAFRRCAGDRSRPRAGLR